MAVGPQPPPLASDAKSVQHADSATPTVVVIGLQACQAVRLKLHCSVQGARAEASKLPLLLTVVEHVPKGVAFNVPLHPCCFQGQQLLRHILQGPWFADSALAQLFWNLTSLQTA